MNIERIIAEEIAAGNPRGLSKIEIAAKLLEQIDARKKIWEDLARQLPKVEANDFPDAYQVAQTGDYESNLAAQAAKAASHEELKQASLLDDETRAASDLPNFEPAIREMIRSILSALDQEEPPVGKCT